MTPSGTTGVVWLRIVLLTLAGAASLAAGLVFLDLIGGNRPSGLDIVRVLAAIDDLRGNALLGSIDEPRPIPRIAS